MKYLVSLLLIFSMRVCFSQESHKLRIVAYTGNVTLDGAPVNSGQLVSSTSRTLEVDKKGSYAYVLTPKGYAMKLMGGKYSIKNVDDFIYRNRYKPRSPITGAVDRSYPYPLKFVGIEGWEHNYLMGDSVFLKWKKTEGVSKIIGPPYRFCVVTMFADTLYKAIVSDYFIKLNLRGVANDNNAVIIDLNDADCNDLVVKFTNASDVQWVSNDLGKISEQPGKDLLELIIYDCNKLDLDVMFRLANISKADHSALDVDIKNYLALLKVKYEYK